ncbi:energy transducer TonB [Tepidimonas charontis]|uniref:TonB C-terminal domain-containing protein n=1 Tax=Tepidimonas charontis TaxID=2267262 RepID=A0A554XF56_9BURK|nr:energy transducer TonB [Tepidimonas charontis]TSE34470.1 hypothetical protein Tchar_01339 [Tepidimonas charontis]
MTSVPLPPSPPAISTPPPTPLTARQRRLVVTAAVLALHGLGIAALYRLDHGTVNTKAPRLVAAALVPVSVPAPAPADRTAMLSRPPAPPARPLQPPPPSPPQRAAAPAAREQVRPLEPTPTPPMVTPTARSINPTEPQSALAVPLASASGEPFPPSALPAAPHPTGRPTSEAEAFSPAGAAATAPAVSPTPPPARIELPSASAAYLNNPPPPYPALSRRLGEEGRVVLRVRIEADGTASAAEIRTSSGYERLDQAALAAVLRWRYVPGTRNGKPEAMWFLVPIHFKLE